MRTLHSNLYKQGSSQLCYVDDRGVVDRTFGMDLEARMRKTAASLGQTRRGNQEECSRNVHRAPLHHFKGGKTCYTTSMRLNGQKPTTRRLFALAPPARQIERQESNDQKDAACTISIRYVHREAPPALVAPIRRD